MLEERNKADLNAQLFTFCDSNSYELSKKDTLWKIDGLIARGANVNARNHYGQTPLHLVVAANHLTYSKEAVKLLLNRGANCNAKDLLGKLPHEARSRHDNGWNQNAILVIEFAEKSEQEKQALTMQNS